MTSVMVSEVDLAFNGASTWLFNFLTAYENIFECVWNSVR